MAKKTKEARQQVILSARTKKQVVFLECLVILPRRTERTLLTDWN